MSVFTTKEHLLSKNKNEIYSKACFTQYKAHLNFFKLLT